MKLPIELSAHLTPEPNSGCWLWTRSLTAEGYVLTVNPNTPVEVERGKCGECGHEPHQGRECFAVKVTPDEKWDGLCKCGTGQEGTK